MKDVGKFYHLVRHMLWKWEMSKKWEICLFKSYYMLILTYTVETWTWAIADINRLMAAEVRFLTSTEGKIKKVEQEMKKENRENLKSSTLEGKLTDNITRWYGHVLRTNRAVIPKKV
jgi:hypothetical protein